MKLGQEPTAVLPAVAPKQLGVLYRGDELVHRHPSEVHRVILADSSTGPDLSTRCEVRSATAFGHPKAGRMTSDKTGQRTAVFFVHTSRPDGIGAIEVVFDNQRAAEEFAVDRSKDQGVLSASVTRYFVGELGNRRPISWFVDGVEQPRRFDRRSYPTDGSDGSPTGSSTSQQHDDTRRPEA